MSERRLLLIWAHVTGMSDVAHTGPGNSALLSDKHSPRTLL
jgi:hypothetical protein